MSRDADITTRVAGRGRMSSTCRHLSQHRLMLLPLRPMQHLLQHRRLPYPPQSQHRQSRHQPWQCRHRCLRARSRVSWVRQPDPSRSCPQVQKRHQPVNRGSRHRQLSKAGSDIRATAARVRICQLPEGKAMVRTAVSAVGATEIGRLFCIGRAYSSPSRPFF